MEYTKVPQAINNVVGDNVQLLAQLFPAAVKDGLVDFEALREELGEFQEVDAEKYELTWSGKQAAKKLSQQDAVNRTLHFVPEDSKNADITENLYIEGDNLEVLKLLRQNYYGAIKMIYIDPPYNTGNDFVYNDKFAMDRKSSDIAEGAADEGGNPLQKNQQSSNRYHANWLNMMYARLKLAKELLLDDGVIFISIDDTELDNLRKLCNEILGEANFIADLCVVNNLKGRNDKKYIARANERLLMYVKSFEFSEYGLSIDSKILNEYKEIDNAGKYRLLELRKRGGPDTRKDRPNMYYPFFVDPVTGEVSLEKDTKHCVEAFPVKSNGVDGRWRWGKEKATLNISYLFGKKVGEKYNIYEKDYLEGNDGIRRVTPKSVLSGSAYSTDVATKEYRALMGSIDFSNPKPLAMLSDLITYVASPNENLVVLDFFSGSATTAHAVMQLNAEDGGNRKFIMIQYPEETDKDTAANDAGFENICEIGKERIRRAGEKILADNAGKEGIDQLDVGFRVFRTADTNIRWNMYEHQNGEQVSVETLQNTPDLADFTEGFNDIDVVYEIMLRQRDIPLSNTLETLTDIGARTYLYASAYLVCLDTSITPELIEKLASLDPLPVKFVFRDSAFGDDINLKDETFRRLKTLVERNSGNAKKTYTVEFI